MRSSVRDERGRTGPNVYLECAADRGSSASEGLPSRSRWRDARQTTRLLICIQSNRGHSAQITFLVDRPDIGK